MYSKLIIYFIRKSAYIISNVFNKSIYSLETLLNPFIKNALRTLVIFLRRRIIITKNYYIIIIVGGAIFL